MGRWLIVERALGRSSIGRHNHGSLEPGGDGHAIDVEAGLAVYDLDD